MRVNKHLVYQSENLTNYQSYTNDFAVTALRDSILFSLT